MFCFSHEVFIIFESHLDIIQDDKVSCATQGDGLSESFEPAAFGFLYRMGGGADTNSNVFVILC